MEFNNTPGYSKGHFKKMNRSGYHKDIPVTNTDRPFSLMNNKMLIGIHKGKHLSELPQSYIKWMLDNFKLSSSYQVELKQYE